MELEDFIQKNKDIILTNYEQGKNYSNIVMMGGYAGLFAIWDFTKANLDKWQSVSVGILALISILIFVLFELYSAWFRSVQTFNLLDQLKKAKELGRFPDDYNQQELKRLEILAKAWPFFFFSSLGTGLLAALILMWAFITTLID